MENFEIEEEKLLEIFKKMNFIRNFELEAKKACDLDFIKIPIYLSVGQESPSATISSFFKPDLIFAQHRAHSVYLAYGGDPDKLINELLGKDEGCNLGRGGSPGIKDPKIGMIGHHGLVGENVPIGVGAALGDNRKKILCIFGDGAAEEDYVFNAISFAFTHKLPVLFICEDNNLSILTKKSERRSWELSDALKGIGMSAVNIPDEPELIAKYVNEFKNNLPAFINCRTCRHLWHVGTGNDGPPEVDRLNIFKQELIKKGIKKEILDEIENQTKRRVEELWNRHLQKQ